MSTHAETNGTVGANIDPAAKEEFALELFRKEIITHHQLGRILGMNRFETDKFLIARDEWAQCMTAEDVWEDLRRWNARAAETTS